MAGKPNEVPGGAAVLRQCKNDIESGALSGAVLLFGREQYLIRAARNAIREEALVEKLVDNFTTAEIEDALAYLVQENLMLHIGGEYLALPVDRVTGR